MNSAIQHLSNWTQYFRYEQDSEQPQPQGISFKKNHGRVLARVVEKMDSAIHHLGNQLRYIHWMEIHQVDNFIHLLNNGSLA